MDYRPLNKVLKDDEWPLPKISDVKHFIHGHSWFSRIDLRDAFHRIHIDERNRDATAFHTPWGTFRFTRMEYGLKTAPAAFQRYLDWILRKHREYALHYMDDILIKSRTQAESRKRTYNICNTLQAHGNDINNEKSEKHKQTITFVGLHISPRGIKSSIDWKKFGGWKVPRNKKMKLSIAGFANCFRDFVPNLAELLVPIYADDQSMSYSDYATKIKNLIVALYNQVTVAHYQYDQDATLHTDASNQAIGAILTQQGKVCAIYSKSLNKSQSKYSTTDREQLALLMGCEKYRIFIQSNKRLMTSMDHTPLLNRKETDLTPRQCRWLTRIHNITNNIVYEKGETNPADWLSRWGTEGGGEIDIM